MTSELDPVDRLLMEHNADDEISASSGFKQTVMDAVYQAATAPPPIPFPWIRSLPWFAGAAITLGAVGVGVWQASVAPAAPAAFVVPPAIQVALNAATTPDCIWATTAVLISLATTVAALRLGTWLTRH